MRSFSPLPSIVIEPIVRTALLEDLGRSGDLTSDAVVPYDRTATLALRARQAGVVAGLDLAAFAFLLVDAAIDMAIHRPDGCEVATGEAIATVTGPARGLLTAERTALNFLSHLSGIATATAAMVEAVRSHKAKIVCTRKTTPGLRALEKYAVRVGGGANHRFGLDDAVLIKDNHIAIAGDIRTAIERARAATGHMIKIEVEVDSLEQLEIALASYVDAVLLDNMSLNDLARAVDMVGGRAITEASGRVTPKTAAAIAATGVDLISVGWLTHSAPILDIGLDVPADANICTHLN
ncbi:MAG: carboxylating nicotinate-nucleotide diphosphorylase [Mesorhizobium sp.]|uniref:carboxylating nicotinate-nucleotide diphosphorylase n=1 Tax=unclassified Mesorhizobium TaxID=325217 RepID=UPI000FCB9E66|nr:MULTISPECIES: carboxylating nicotinate-nucleotide diphosphorylase [unclassified Mesorhizobium]RUV66494.1 carboxylating nicotinate-nucleotide diphosphorylase [Mesorhizobium sp. M5C.F.Cr.IN.023.01.1.1]RWI67747.1 MAG: carboxylating nicotinate-nucleotide diphosphorylase [Mesorhizobium sp.]RWI83786.1 MAG: carboxylating nicotinate-nucleotide diphosphorylase [Mesorhizobium sp.]RWJ60416.1 MAG: carboxylating nicotinate-nucleotide diphosphorylase [Mesorhizobium sp.]